MLSGKSDALMWIRFEFFGKEVFTDLSVWMGIRGVIDRINANAAA